jgi:multidrug efflux pump subunit AcrB
MAAQDISFPAMRDKQRLLAQMTLDDPAVRTVTAFAGGGRNSNNVGFMFVALKPLNERPYRAYTDSWFDSLRQKLHIHPAHVSADQYTLSDENLEELNAWAPQLEARAKTMPELRDVSTDQQDRGLAANLVIDRDAASRLGITASAIDNVLYDAFGQREVSTMYTALNQYYVVMEVDPKYQLSPDALNGIFIKASNVVGATTAMPATVTATAAAASPTAAPVTTAPPAMPITLTAVTLPTTAATTKIGSIANTTIPPLTTPVPSTLSAPASTAIVSAVTSPTASAASVASAVSAPASSTGGAMVPLSTIARYEQQRTSLAVNHQGQYPAVTLTFNLAPNVALGDAVTALEKVQGEMGMPSAVHATFQGSAQAFQDSLKNEKWLILAALVAVYIVLGILYESLIHPLTILSTLPPAGVGAILALLLTGTDLSIIALIGIILLIGIVKKNAIMMIDFALQAERDQGLPPVEAIYQACLLRFRPIMMTTMAALFGGLPLAIGMGVGSELRKPLGITIVGGLIVSQMLTLFTTPVVYLFFDRLQWRVMKLRRIGVEMEEAPGD